MSEFEDGYNMAFEQAQDQIAEVSIAVPMGIKSLASAFIMFDVPNLDLKIPEDSSPEFLDGVGKFFGELSEAYREQKGLS